MIRYILKQIKYANLAVVKGNIYRRKKYGEPDTFAQSLEKAMAWRKWYRENCLVDCTPRWSTSQEERFKSKFGYWDCWTGGRYVRVENQNPKPHTNLTSICRSDPVTGKWYPL